MTEFNDGTQRKIRPDSNSGPRKTLSQRDPFIVYIPELPSEEKTDEPLDDTIRHCLEQKHKQKVLEIRCYTELGIGVIYVENEEDKHQLVKVIGKVFIDPRQNITVSLVDELELISYIVIENNDAKGPPTINDICHRWKQFYKVDTEPQCRTLSTQFPNIFSLTTFSVDELVKLRSKREFSINGHLASVYFCADCCFFEDLPRTTTLDRLKKAVKSKIPERCISDESIYIQYNRDAASAVVLAIGRSKIWASQGSITLDERTFIKKTALACRLLVKNVPSNISSVDVREHKIFNGKVIKLTRNDDHIILELSDRKVFDDCVDRGAFKIGDTALGLEIYTFTNHPEDCEIDAETWYETEMCEHKLDITPFILDFNHRIFQYKWSSSAFREQMSRQATLPRTGSKKELEQYHKEANERRHYLRMTVILNTIGIVRRGYYRAGEQIVKIDDKTLKTVLYNHQSKLEGGRTITFAQLNNTPYASTLVRVVNEDCLILNQKLVNDGYRPVVLNMANATTPGGGYRKGDGAQEETLFRRSNYYRSLDMELDDGQPTDRFYCSASGKLESFSKSSRLYPMQEYGAVYTSGLTVFRREESAGYALMDTPMCDVAAIAMAAYREPKLDDSKQLTDKFSIDTRKKIENIFAISYYHKHDSMVLSAFGCGAFRNPPKHVARIFKSVIDQYAGYFKRIYFAIVDDHNAGQDLNPDGNYIPFKEILDQMDVTPRKHRMIDMMLGPYRILNTNSSKNEFVLSDIRICYMEPCHFGAKCRDLKNDQHCQEYAHPPLCPYADGKKPCKEKTDSQHTLWFRHRQPCSYGGECNLIEKDASHSSEYEHPAYCRDGGHCEDMTEEHLKAYRHLPLCKHHRDCIHYGDRNHEHCQEFRHCVPMCRFGYFCVRFHDKKHCDEESHPFRPACSLTPFGCTKYDELSRAKDMKTLSIAIQKHCSEFSHVCRYGRTCHDKSDAHWRTTIHIARNVCSYGDQCKKKHDEDHLNSFTHPGIADIRSPCSHPHDCRDRRKADHVIEYRHAGNHDRSGAINYFGHNNGVDFYRNQKHMIKAVDDYAHRNYSKSILPIPKEVLKCILSLQAVHRCSKAVFESMLVHGHVMSLEHMDRLKKPDFAARAVQEHKHIRSILERHKIKAVEDHARHFIQAIVSREYEKMYSGGWMGIPRPRSSSTSSNTHEDDIRVQERFLKSMNIRSDDIDTIRQKAMEIAQASWNLHHSPTGLKYPPDLKLGTDKHVFSILGPHFGHYYGDIFLVFKSDVMLHPDAYFSIQAGTSFLSQRAFEHRTWAKFKTPPTEEDIIQCYNRSKLHCSIPGYEVAAGAELIAITGARNKTIDVSIDDIIERWKHVDSHETFEGHLPQLVPLDHIEEVYIPQSLFYALTPAAQESARKTFRDSLHITKHDVNAGAMGGGGPRPSDNSRAKYQEYVNDKIIEKLRKRMERSRTCRGSVLTLPPSDLARHVLLPCNITRAYEQYCQHDKNKEPSNMIDIYWQAIHGDMMLTLSNEPIDPNKNQPNIRCLVCYIAANPTTTGVTTAHDESLSYLNAADPYRHPIIIKTRHCSASSLSFHYGCNADDFQTYCLKLDKTTGEASLSHAGPNSIYCQQIIQCKFSKSELDFSRLHHIHVSAGSQKVPIRNLVVTFEPISDLHPSFDKTFKRGDNPFSSKKHSAAQPRTTSPKKNEDAGDKSPSFLHKAMNKVGQLFGYDGDQKELSLCPDSIHCKLWVSPQHMKEYLHPCPYSELCRDKDREPHLTHKPHKADRCPHEKTCRKLEDPHHRFKYRHGGYADFMIPCGAGAFCSNHKSDHRTKYCHEKNDKENDSTDKRSKANSKRRDSEDQRILCRYGRKCWYQDDTRHCSKYSHHDEHSGKASNRSHHSRTPCRYGQKCRNQDDTRHCSEFSHPTN